MQHLDLHTPILPRNSRRLATPHLLDQHALVVEDFQSLAPYEIYATLVDRGAPSGWFSAKTLPPEKPTGHGDLIRRASRDQYGRAVTNEVPQPTSELPRAEPGSHRRARRT
jgi:hypothetical protein